MDAVGYREELAHKRCFNHASREAAAQCRTCERFFCRECVTEHEGRVVCAQCLGKLTGGVSDRRQGVLGLFRWAGCILGVLCVWVFFYYLGKLLLRLPTSFHEGAMWAD